MEPRRSRRDEPPAAGAAGPVRRALYRLVVERGGDLGREDAAEAIGVSRSLAAYHLDRLVSDGLLEARFERRSGRQGPGAGRPAKLYHRSPRALQITLPPRNYEVAARLLARAVEVAPDARDTLLVDACRYGEELARGAAHGEGGRLDLRSELTRRGYEPSDDGDVLRCATAPSARWPPSTRSSCAP